MVRIDGRKPNQMREVRITRNYIPYAEGSAMIEVGKTKVICTASVEPKVPLFIKEQGLAGGWISAEYSLLPRATHTRIIRDSVKGRISGRSHEIQRIIGRSMRAVVDLNLLNNMTIWIDCDVIVADGGTRAASITGSYIALFDCVNKLMNEKKITEYPIRDYVAATSVGQVKEEVLLDLCFEEDKCAEVDLNVVMTGSLDIIEIQGTAEGKPFSIDKLSQMLDLAAEGISHLIGIQRVALGESLIKKK